MAVTIRPARADDRPRLHAIWAAAVDATHQFVAPGDLAAIGDEVRDIYLPHADLLVAADGNDRPLGWLGRAPGEIEALFVDPAAHGRGVGRALVAAASEPGESMRVDVNEGNAGGVAFWRRLGFVEEGRSATDGHGRPYPLIHLSRSGGEAPISGS